MVVASRRWSLALGAVAVVLSAVAVLVEGLTPGTLLSIGVLAAYVAVWFAVRRRARDGNPVAVALTAVTVLTAGALTAGTPVLATFQVFAYPAVWALSRSVRGAVVADVGVALSVAGGFLVSLGTAPDDVVRIAIIQTLSLAFSLVMGFWITGVEVESEKRRHLVEQLTAAQEELAVLHRDAGVTAERERLARELHDTIAQSLTGLVLVAQRARRELAAGALGDATLELLEDGTRETLAETRALVTGSARVDLAGGGIEEALERLAERVRRETGLTVTVTAGLDVRLDRDTEVVLLRCAQEGLANVRKHARARAVRVELEVDAGVATLRVIDDGRGFDPDARRTGFGLDGLRDRIALVGGELMIDGTAGATTLTARLPSGARHDEAGAAT